MQKYYLPLFTATLLVVLCIIMPSKVQSQSGQTPEQLRQQFDTSNRESAYSNLMQKGEPGYRVICDLFADGKISMHEWINWEYDYTTRMDSPDAGNNIDNYIYTKSTKDNDFLIKMAKAFANSDFPNNAFVEMMQDERRGARILGYSVVQIRYTDAPKFAPDSSKTERIDQLATMSRFLAAKPKK